MNRTVQIALVVALIVILAIMARTGGVGDWLGGGRDSDSASASNLATPAGDAQPEAAGVAKPSRGESGAVGYPADDAIRADSSSGQGSAVPIESFLIGKTGLRADAAQDVVSTSKFDLLFAKMQQGLDANSLEQTKLYRSSMQNMVATDKRLSVERVVCGHQLCAAEIAATGADEKEVSQLFMSDSGDNPHMYATVQAMADKPDSLNRYAFRMIFTIDPKLNAIESTYRP